MSNFKKYLALFVFSGILGATFDGFHSHSGTLAYHHPVLLKMEWWVPPLFGLAGLGIGWGRLWWDEIFGIDPPERAWGEVMAGVCLFGIQYYTSGFLKTGGAAKFAVLGLFAWALWRIFDGTASGLALCAVNAVAGCAVEIGLSWWGKFYYLDPDILGVPYWLPFLYVAGTPVVGNVARWLDARVKAGPVYERG